MILEIKSSPRPNIAEKFHSGSYAEVVALLFESSRKFEPTLEEWAFGISSLAVVGRGQDAMLIYRTRLGTSKDNEGENSLEIQKSQQLAEFFIFLSVVRAGDYKEAKIWLNSMKLRAKAASHPVVSYYYCQGGGFLWNFLGRFRKSLTWAECAWKVSFKENYLFGMALSSDLLAHNLIQTGQIAKGLALFEKTKAFADSLVNKSIRLAVEVSEICYRAQYGRLKNPEGALRDKLQSISTVDSYSRSNLYIELIRQTTLKGKLKLALETLEEARTEIEKIGHRRQRALWRLRLAYIFYLRSETSEALKELSEGLDLLRDSSDDVVRLQLLGLKFRITRDSGLEAEIKKLTVMTGRHVSQQTMMRDIGIETDSGDDWLGKMVTKIKIEKNVSWLREAIERGFFLFAREWMDASETKQVIVDLLPKRLIIFSREEIFVSDQVISEILRKLFLLISEGPQSKGELVENLWGYHYESLRHDPIVYALIHRLRKALGPINCDLRIDGEAYEFICEIKVGIFKHLATTPPAEPEMTLAQSASPEINWRQLDCLEWMSKNRGAQGYVGVSDLVKKYKVSAITASRDLSELFSLGLVQRIGKGRSTKYRYLKFKGSI
jgi:tetratricopeptide (TPR) repeat protein